jgi:hypothetical protein
MEKGDGASKPDCRMTTGGGDASASDASSSGAADQRGSVAGYTDEAWADVPTVAAASEGRPADVVTRDAGESGLLPLRAKRPERRGVCAEERRVCCDERGAAVA